MAELELQWPKIGNEKAIEFLSLAISSDRVAQTYIFIGPDDLGKSTVALAFARNLMGSVLQGDEAINSDLYILKPEDGKKSISIEQVRQLIKDLSLSSFLNSYKIGIIKEADSLTAEAQSAILKTLEEPRDKVIIILLSKSEDGLLPTILSRAQKLYFNPVKAETIYDYLITEHNTQRSLAKDLANLSLGRPLKAALFLENPDVYAAYLKKITILLEFFGKDINWRLAELDNLMSDKTYSAAAVAAATSIVDMLDGLMRDLLLLHYNQPEKIQHSVIKNDLERILVQITALSSIGPSDQDNLAIFLLTRFKLTALARNYLLTNVNPRLVLEQLAINL